MDIFREHEIFEIEVLDLLHRSGLLAPLVFGGGTMLRLCHELNRYSVDLDFWFIKAIHIMHRFFWFITWLLTFLVGKPLQCHAQDVLTLETIINRALKANRGILDSQDDIRRAGLQLASAEADFELKILPGAGVGFSGAAEGSDRSTENLKVTLRKRLEYGTQVSLTPGVQRKDGEYKSLARMRIVQPLLRGLGRDFNLSQIHASRYDQRFAHRAHYQKEVATVLGAVQRAYDAIRQRELSVLQAESTQRLLHHAEASAIKEPIGLVSAIDLYRARIQANPRSFPGEFPRESTWGVSLGSTTDIQRTSQRAAFEESLLNIRSVVRQQTNIRDEVTNQVKREVRALQRQAPPSASRASAIRSGRISRWPICPTSPG